MFDGILKAPLQKVLQRRSKEKIQRYNRHNTKMLNIYAWLLHSALLLCFDFYHINKIIIIILPPMETEAANK